MKNVKVLGMGCRACYDTAKLISQIATEKQIDIELQKLEEVSDVLEYGVRATPAVVINNEVVHMGGIPAKEVVAEWI
ncbi:thioredoxin family protein [Shewanella gelidii]|uniref:Glutaredoxin n=1 Tax=Shewanella gelidii TaxID=1642821 RepID=A0A917NDH5_9GAMM|nr:thioredoxin family protein [Shewanella gelidii]MCL1099407.1 thioredoxin family protein [Shewanella gelidii]GGI91530.1 glutaredoxin [Shewanella gelidii]